MVALSRSFDSSLSINPAPFRRENHPLSKNIQTLDMVTFTGGGNTGINSLYMAERFEQDTGRPIHEQFDRIIGTSTGAITAALSVPLEQTGEPLMTPGDAIHMYKSMFDGQPLPERLTSIFGWVSPKYSAEKVEDVFDQVFGNLKLSDFADGLHIHVVDLETGRSRFLTSEQAKINDAENFLMKDLLRAAIAAPVFIRQHQLTNMLGEDVHFTDGGLDMNDPSPLAFDAAKADGYDPKNMSLMTFATGFENNTEIPDFDRGVLGSLPSAIKSHFQIASRRQREALHRELGDRYFLADVDLTGTGISMASPLDEIAPHAEQAAKDNYELDRAIGYYNARNAQEGAHNRMAQYLSQGLHGGPPQGQCITPFSGLTRII